MTRFPDTKKEHYDVIDLDEFGACFGKIESNQSGKQSVNFYCVLIKIVYIYVLILGPWTARFDAQKQHI